MQSLLVGKFSKDFSFSSILGSLNWGCVLVISESFFRIKSPMDLLAIFFSSIYDTQNSHKVRDLRETQETI